MNKTQKKILNDAADKIDTAKTEIYNIIEELQEQFDEMSEKTQEGDRGQKLQEDIDNLSGVDDQLDSALSDLRSVAT